MFMVIWDIESMARDQGKIERASSLIRSARGNIHLFYEYMHASIHLLLNVCFNMLSYKVRLASVLSCCEF